LTNIISGNIKRVLFFLPSKRWGWKEKFVINSIKILERSGLECYLVCKSGTRISDNAIIENIKCLHMISASSATLLPGQLYRFYKNLLTEYEIDVIHLFSLFHFFTLRWASESFPTVPVFLNFLFLKQFKKWNRLKNFLLNRVDHVFVTNESDIKIVSDLFKIPIRKISSHNLSICDESKINFVKNSTKNRFISTYLDNDHSIDLFETLFNGLNLFHERFREYINLNIVFDKLNFDRTTLALLNSLLENFPNIKVTFLDLSEELVTDCHIILSKDIIDEYTLDLMRYSVPLLIPRGSILHEQTISFKNNIFYKEGDLRELTNLLAINIFKNSALKEHEIDRERFIKKNNEFIFQKIVIQNYRTAKEKRIRKYSSRL